MQIKILQLFDTKLSRDLTVVIILLMIVPFLSSNYFGTVVAKAIIFAIVAISLDIAWGYGGILSLGHSAFFGLGAYAFTLFAMSNDASMYLFIGIVAGIVLPLLLALLISWFVFFSNTTPFYIGVVTLSMAILAERIVVRFSDLTGGMNGVSGIPKLPFGNLGNYYFVLFIFVILIYAIYRFVHSDMGKIIAATRNNEERTRFLGQSTAIVRTIVFSVSGLLAGFAGVLYATYTGFISPTLVSFVLSTQIIIWVAVGGRGRIIGAVAGALLINILSPYFNETFPHIWQIFLGLLFIIVVVFFPNGLYRLISRKEEKESFELIQADETSDIQREKSTLAIEQMKVSFGPIEVLKGLNLTVHNSEIQCIIGPNGAGKSTLVDAITGKNKTISGKTTINSASINNLHPEKIVKKQLVRTFQSTSVIDDLTVGENLQIASAKGTFLSSFRRSKEIVIPPAAYSLMKMSKLDEKLSEKAGEISHGEQQLLELSMALSLEPRILLLDEPTAGLTSTERIKIGKLLKMLAHKENLALVVIEHDIEFVKTIADRVTVLYDGSIAAEGTVDEIVESELVKNVYLGGDISELSAN